MDKRDKVWFTIVVSIGVLLGTIFILGLLVLFLLKGKIIDKDDINLLDMFFKASFTFFGSIFSIGTSLFIFHIQNNKKMKEEEKEKDRLVSFIDTSLTQNLEEVNKIYEIISKKGIDTFLSEYISNESKIREIFLKIFFSIDIESIKSLITELDHAKINEAELVKTYSYISRVQRLLTLLLNEIENEESKKEVIRNLFKIVESKS